MKLIDNSRQSTLCVAGLAAMLATASACAVLPTDGAAASTEGKRSLAAAAAYLFVGPLPGDPSSLAQSGRAPAARGLQPRSPTGLGLSGWLAIGLAILTIPSDTRQRSAVPLSELYPQFDSQNLCLNSGNDCVPLKAEGWLESAAVGASLFRNDYDQLEWVPPDGCTGHGFNPGEQRRCAEAQQEPPEELRELREGALQNPVQQLIVVGDSEAVEAHKEFVATRDAGADWEEGTVPLGDRHGAPQPDLHVAWSPVSLPQPGSQEWPEHQRMVHVLFDGVLTVIVFAGGRALPFTFDLNDEQQLIPFTFALLNHAGIRGPLMQGGAASATGPTNAISQVLRDVTYLCYEKSRCGNNVHALTHHLLRRGVDLSSDSVVLIERARSSLMRAPRVRGSLEGAYFLHHVVYEHRPHSGDPLVYDMALAVDGEISSVAPVRGLSWPTYLAQMFPEAQLPTSDYGIRRVPASSFEQSFRAHVDQEYTPADIAEILGYESYANMPHRLQEQWSPNEPAPSEHTLDFYRMTVEWQSIRSGASD